MLCRTIACAAALIILATTALAAAAPLDDPHEIMARHAEAVGGLDRLRAEEHAHWEATLTVEGLSGTIRHWEAPGHRRRSEIDLTVLVMTSGDDGESVWEVDPNGKLRVEMDPDALARREVAARLSLYEHVDPDSDIFAAQFDGVEDVNGVECYVVRVDNNINDDHVVFFYNTSTFLIEKEVRVTPSGDEEVFSSDYRDVGGLLRPFVSEITLHPTGQKQEIRVTSFEIGEEADPELFAVPDSGHSDFRFTSGDGAEGVPFRLTEDHLFIDVTIDSLVTLWVIDTGASSSVIDNGYAERLGLETSGTMTGQGAGSTVEVSFVTLPPFSIEGVEFDEQTVAAIDIAPLFRRVSELEVAGILGYDFLSRFVTRVDYANEKLSFYDPADFVYEGDGVVLDAPLKGNCFSVPGTVDGTYSGMWNLDLGATGATFHYPFARDNGLLERPGVAGVGFGAGGRITSLRSTFDTFELAGFTINDPIISVPSEEMAGGFGGGELVGNLGNRLFRHFVLYLDYERQQVVFEKGGDFDTVFPNPKAGFGVWLTDEGEYEVFYVAAGTPGADAGLEEGDIIETVDGRTIREIGGLLAFAELSRADSGTTYALRVRRGGVSFETPLVLREIY